MIISDLAELEQFYIRAKSALYQNKSVLVYAFDADSTTPRSTEQNDLYWKFNTEIADFLNMSNVTYGYHKKPYTKQIVHSINKALFDIETTATMTQSEFCRYLDTLNAFWRDRTNGFFNF